MSKSWDSRTSQTARAQSPGSQAAGLENSRFADLQAAANRNPEPQHLQTLQGLFETAPVQRAAEEEELGQMMQRVEMEEEELMQGKADGELATKNNTGLPDNLKTGMEAMSGMSLDHVKVHHNSDKPAAVQAHAYAQGSDIHLASGQEKHLPHELGHVVQQAQGRVQPTTSVGGMQVNDNPGLESEATAMGDKALQMAQDRKK